MDVLEWIQEGSPAAIVTMVLLSLACIGVVFLPFMILARRGSQRSADVRRAAQNWSVTSGVIVTSRVDVSGSTQVATTPHVVYRYTIGGQQYEGSDIVAGDRHRFDRSLSSSQAYALIDNYPVGAQITVYYDPADPSRAALER